MVRLIALAGWLEVVTIQSYHNRETEERLRLPDNSRLEKYRLSQRGLELFQSTEAGPECDKEH